MSNYVFVLDTLKTPQTPVHPAVARKLLANKQAAVFKRYPFTIILKTVSPGPLFVHAQRLKIDPGSKITGLALLDGNRVIWAAELVHRGQQIKAALETRQTVRRSRRHRKTRYRPQRVLNRTKPQGWIPPSLQHRVQTTMTWVHRLRKLCWLTALSQELVRFDTQLMQDAEISGVAYQQGELAGYEVREYLLEKWNRTCAYCHAKNVPLEVEHIIPKSRGGTNRVSNLTLACNPCNQKKDNQTAAEFGFPDIQAQARQPLKDATAVNVTHWALYRALQVTGLPVEVGTGGRTKFNRTRLGLPKTHWLDAVAIGKSTPGTLELSTHQPLLIKAMGHGRRQMCRTNAYGFPVAHRARHKEQVGIHTGDIIKAVVPHGKYVGAWIGRAVVRVNGRCNISSATQNFNVHHKYCTKLWKADGYTYGQ